MCDGRKFYTADNPAESSEDERKIKAAEKEAIPDRKKSGLHSVQ